MPRKYFLVNRGSDLDDESDDDHLAKADRYSYFDLGNNFLNPGPIPSALFSGPQKLGNHSNFKGPNSFIEDGIEKQVLAGKDPMVAKVMEGCRRLKMSSHDQEFDDDVMLEVKELTGIFRTATATENDYKNLLYRCADTEYAQMLLNLLQMVCQARLEFQAWNILIYTH